jgi:hypothetical protein
LNLLPVDKTLAIEQSTKAARLGSLFFDILIEKLSPAAWYKNDVAMQGVGGVVFF